MFYPLITENLKTLIIFDLLRFASHYIISTIQFHCTTTNPAPFKTLRRFTLFSLKPPSRLPSILI